MEGDQLMGRYGRLSDVLKHQQYDTFALPVEVGGTNWMIPVHFKMGMNGSIQTAVLPLEPAGDPIVFTRVAGDTMVGDE